MVVLSDRWRPVVVPTALLALLALCLWWVGLHHRGTIGHLARIENPAAFDGDEVVLSLVRVVSITDPSHYRVAYGILEVEVLGPTASLEVGRDVTIVGRWEADGPHVEAARVRVAPQRGSKKALGLLGLGTLAVLLPVWFRPTRSGMALRG